MIKTLSARAALLAAALGLAACDTPIEKRDCNDASVQETARKLLVMQFDDYSKPQTRQERLLQGFARKQDTEVIHNTIKTHFLKPDSVQLSEVKNLFQPETPQAERPAGMQKAPYLYGCSAKAKVELPAAAAERLAKLPVLAKITQIEGRTLTLDIVYTTERHDDGKRMQVGVAMAHPMLPMVLAVALRNDREPEAESTEKAASAP